MINYEMSVEDIYENFTLLIIQQLRISMHSSQVVHPYSIPLDASTEPLHLPSWVPNWQIPVSSNLFITLLSRHDRLEDFSTSGKSGCKITRSGAAW